MSSRRIITIARQCGSNGRVIGKALAEKLNINFYDKELLELAEERSDIPYQELEKVDEKRASLWRYPVETDAQMKSKFRFEPMNDVLFEAQSQIIKERVEKEDCVIVGRCADDILRGNPGCRSVFIYADLDLRMKRVSKRTLMDEKEALAWIKKADKQRQYYYNYYTDKKWGSVTSYDLCIDSGRFYLEEMLTILETMYNTIS